MKNLTTNLPSALSILSKAATFASAALLFSVAPLHSGAGQSLVAAPAAQPSLVLYSYPAEAIENAKKRVLAQDEGLQPALAQLVKEADALLKAPMLSVLDKKVLAVSGDPHDYFSFGTYWWPNPDTRNGLPYVRRDGQRNPETRGSNSDNFRGMARAVYTLGLAYYLTGEERYAQNAVERMRIWFLDPATRMNPHLKYAQAIPGRVDGRGIGIIDANVFNEMIDGINLMDGSPAWTPELEAGLKQWLGSYLNWLLTSENGKSADSHYNNHGTYYDAQVASIALFIGRPELARKVTGDALKKRLLTQVQPDGSQPHEMKRTLSMAYSTMNTKGMLMLAALSAAADGKDWWAFESPKGISLHKAVAFIAPYIDENLAWPQEDIREDNIRRRRSIRELTTLAAALSKDPLLTAQVRDMAARDVFAAERWQFYLPPQEQ